ncbi:rhomboid family intramembrane serine protease [Pedobacter caeni]|uniref:Rhomboid protease GluP n=1 Tax=Pedobacter caeni TaxID=288992 RepID=A0A1M5PFB5_9SPHI|nr:rhomboid family intramembrane serine protease [Pedobacter caeni]SHG99953.1 rhomboid protease GluP [Pedobacter caeni]
MSISWGYSPKVEKFIPLGEYPADKYLIIVRQVVENLGWKLSHVSESGLIAYTGLSLQSYSEEISIRIKLNFAIFKSECVGIQMLFNDYGKNEQNLQKFFDEFEYVQYHLKDTWEEELIKFHEEVALQDDQYFEKAPLAAKDKIRNVFYLFIPRKGYLVTPILLYLNIGYYLAITVRLYFLSFSVQRGEIAPENIIDLANHIYSTFGVNSRDAILNGQFWRLISHQFIHFNLSHLFFNMYALIYIGLMVENKLGGWKTLAIYLSGGICGGLISVIGHRTGVMGGASGAITSLFGAFLALLLCKAFEKNANRALLISTLIVVALMLFNGLMKRQVDNSAHIGGLVSGFLIGYLLYQPTSLGFKTNIYQRAVVAVLLVLTLAAVIFQFTPRYQKEAYEELVKQYLENNSRFMKIYTINNSMSKEDKIRLVTTDGVEAWKKNLDIVKKMEKLLLLEEDKAAIKFRAIQARRGHAVSLLMVRNYQADDAPYLNQIRRLLADMNNIVVKDGDKE